MVFTHKKPKMALKEGYNAVTMDSTLNDFGSTNLGGSGNLHFRQDLHFIIIHVAVDLSKEKLCKKTKLWRLLWLEELAVLQNDKWRNVVTDNARERHCA